MIKITVYYPGTPPAATDMVVFSAESDEVDGVSTDLTEAVELVETKLVDVEGILSIETFDDEHGDLSVAYDPEIAPWDTWYTRVLEGIHHYYRNTYRREIEIEHQTQASNEL